MKGITKITMKMFLRQAEHMFDVINKAIYGETTHKPTDYEQQMKLVRIALPAILAGLTPVIDGLRRLADEAVPIAEDNEDYKYRYYCSSTVDSYTTDCPEEVLQWMSEQLKDEKNIQIDVFDNGEHVIQLPRMFKEL